MPLMPWQQHVVDIAYELTASGSLVYREINFTVPRQNGKTAVAMAAKVFRCTKFGGRQNVVYTAQTRNAASKKFLGEHCFILDHSPFRSHYTKRLSNGSEAILWKNASKWAIDAPTRSASHGDTLDHGDIDEAFAHHNDRVEAAMSPAMITRASPQIWVYSTAGDAQSYYWWRKVLAGRKSGDTGDAVAYFEWSAADDADPADPLTWASCNPALGHTISMDALRAEWSKAQRKGVDGVDMFRRAHLNQWPEVPVLDDQPGLWLVIPADEWAAAKDIDSTAVGQVALAVDTTPDRAWSSIGVCGLRADGSEHVEIIDHRPGTDWVVERVRDLRDRWAPVGCAIDAAGPVGSLADDLGRVLGDRLVKVSAREHAQAAGSFVDGVHYRTVRHRGSSELDAAVACATKRPLAEAFAFARAGLLPVSPLVAVALARFVFRRTPAAVDLFAY